MILLRHALEQRRRRNSVARLQCGKPIGPTYAPGSIQANFSSSRVQIETRSLSCPDQYLGIHSSHEFTKHERKKMR